MAALSTHLRTRSAVLALLVVLPLAVLSCAAPERPRQAQSSPPTRIVSLVPATTEILFAIGTGDRVAGVGSYDRFPPEVEALPKVGGLIDPDTERILALRPDLVITYATQTELQQQLDRAGVAFFSYRHRALPDVIETVRMLGARVGAKEPAEALASRMERELAEVRDSVEGRPRPSVLLVFGRDPGSLRNVHASGGYGFLADILEIAGGDNVFASIDRESVQVSTERLLSLRPDVIIELVYDAAGAGSPARLPEDWRALPSIPAVRAGRVHVLRGDEFVVPGPRVVVAARRIAETLHQR
jgi:iron complex transport system substrate-binding protein